jgi:hypothetical protein
VVCSIALQHGTPVDVIRRALPRDPRGIASSPLGITLDRIANEGGNHEAGVVQAAAIGAAQAMPRLRPVGGTRKQPATAQSTAPSPTASSTTRRSS